MVIAAWASRYLIAPVDETSVVRDDAVMVAEDRRRKIPSRSQGRRRPVFLADEPIDVGGLGIGVRPPYQLLSAALGGVHGDDASALCQSKEVAAQMGRAVTVNHTKTSGDPKDVRDVL